MDPSIPIQDQTVSHDATDQSTVAADCDVTAGGIDHAGEFAISGNCGAFSPQDIKLKFVGQLRIVDDAVAGKADRAGHVQFDARPRVDDNGGVARRAHAAGDIKARVSAGKYQRLVTAEGKGAGGIIKPKKTVSFQNLKKLYHGKA